MAKEGCEVFQDQLELVKGVSVNIQVDAGVQPQTCIRPELSPMPCRPRLGATGEGRSGRACTVCRVGSTDCPCIET